MRLFALGFFITVLPQLTMLCNALEINPRYTKPNIVLIMSDDQGWGQTGYYNHPILKTPNLDAMASNGLRFDRFYAGAPECSPSRATVLTGRSNDRTGVRTHGDALRLQEKNLATALKNAGYKTGHFGKWHLNGLRGPGAPVLANDPYNPGAFGFETWLSVTNFFDINPLMSRNGQFEAFKGESSEIIVDEALKFISKAVNQNKPFFAVIWSGSPHRPWHASIDDRKQFQQLDVQSQHRYGELVAFDRSIGTLRSGLRKLAIEENTIIWFTSDNGGLREPKTRAVHALRGDKGDLWEGGIRVPGIVEWPRYISPRITLFPAATLDIFPTIADILGISETAMLNPIDGISLLPLFKGTTNTRTKPIPFRIHGNAALIDNGFKLIRTDPIKYQLYNLEIDNSESQDVSASYPELFNKLIQLLTTWEESVKNSEKGKDYAEQKVNSGHKKRRFWMKDKLYEPYLDTLKKRQEFRGALRNKIQ